MPRPAITSKLLPVATAALLLGALGCGGDARPERSGGTPVRITMRDFRIAKLEPVPAGELALAIKNKGPTAHELIVIREPRGPLPMREDGATVDEERLKPATPGVVEAFPAGQTRPLRVRVTPGRYVLICNMSGHYLGGMRAVLVVT